MEDSLVSNSFGGGIISNSDSSEDENVKYFSSIPPKETNYTLKRRCHNETREEKLVVSMKKKKEDSLKGGLLPSQIERKVKSPIGKVCCKQKCLSTFDLSYEETLAIYNEWNLEQTEKIKHLMNYLNSCLADPGSSHSHIIGMD